MRSSKYLITQIDSIFVGHIYFPLANAHIITLLMVRSITVSTFVFERYFLVFKSQTKQSSFLPAQTEVYSLFDKCFGLKILNYAIIICTFNKSLVIPFGHHLSHVTLDTEDPPGLNAHATGGFSSPANGCIKGSYQCVFRTGAPRQRLPVELHTGMVIAWTIFLEGLTRGTRFSTCKDKSQKEYIVVGLVITRLLWLCRSYFYCFCCFNGHRIPRAWGSVPFCPL